MDEERTAGEEEYGGERASTMGGASTMKFVFVCGAFTIFALLSIYYVSSSERRDFLKREKAKRTPPARERKNKRRGLNSVSPVMNGVATERVKRKISNSSDTFIVEEGRSVARTGGLRDNQRRRRRSHSGGRSKTILQTMEEFSNTNRQSKRLNANTIIGTVNSTTNQGRELVLVRNEGKRDTNRDTSRERSEDAEVEKVPMLKFSKSIDIEVEAFTKRLMKSQTESPDQKMKIILPKGALEKMKRFSLENRHGKDAGHVDT